MFYTERLRAFFLGRPQRTGMGCWGLLIPLLLVKNLSEFTVKDAIYADDLINKQSRDPDFPPSSDIFFG
jgi:hypothetical protein